jgi:RNA polymerase sigma-70 factor (ECF subfamily)
MTDEPHIIQRVLDGDTESFRLLVEHYERPVASMIRNVTGDAQSCEDLAQDVFLAAFAQLKTFDPARSRFSTWLLTIARNKSINMLKKKRPRVSAEPSEPVDCTGPLENVTRREAFARLDKALLSLPGRQRRALTLVEFEGLSYEEAAVIEGTRTGTIKSRVSRARAQLAERLRAYEKDDA